jgi:sugar phosphate isomerase/epimerase
MDFGIMSTQMELLVPAGLPPEGFLEHIASFSHADLLRDISDCGFNIIELGGDLEMLLPHFYGPDAIRELSELKSELGLRYTVHLPLWSVEPSTPLTPVRQGSIQATIDHIQIVQPLEPEVYVLHATGALAAEFYRMNLPEAAKGYLLRQFQSDAKVSIQKILDATGIPSRKIAIETIEFPFDYTKQLAEELDLSICFDTGHVLVGYAGPVNFFDALDQCLPRITEIHLHDSPWQGTDKIIAYGKDHQALGKGDLDVTLLFTRLVEAGFFGPLIFELTVSEALESIEVIRKANPEINILS